MGSSLKDFIYTPEMWPEEVLVLEQPGKGSTSGGQGGKQDNNQINNHKFELPDELGILAIRNAVVFPGTVAPLAVGREKSKALLKDVVPNETVIGILTQRKPDTDKPEFADLYKVGTAAMVLKIIKAPQGSISIFVHGIARFEVTGAVATEPYLKAKVRLLDTSAKVTKRLRALMVNVRQTASRVIALSPNVPE
jgi:ATP-dependent Lon protease